MPTDGGGADPSSVGDRVAVKASARAPTAPAVITPGLAVMIPSRRTSRVAPNELNRTASPPGSTPRSHRAVPYNRRSDGGRDEQQLRSRGEGLALSTASENWFWPAAPGIGSQVQRADRTDLCDGRSI
jgi:hypothetical protein